MSLKITTQNIQKARISDPLVLSLITKSNVTFLQELSLVEDFTFQFTNKSIYYNAARSRTAIIVDNIFPIINKNLTSITLKPELKKNITDIIIDISQNKLIWLINIYNPNQYANQRLLQDQLQLSIISQYQNLQTRLPDKTINIVFAGDFNNFIDPSDSLNYRYRENTVADSLTKLTKLLDLKDAYKTIKHSIKKSYTNRSTTLGSSRRLDRFYISKRFLHDKNINWVLSQANIFMKSTHESVTVELTLTSSKVYHNMKRFRLTDKSINILKKLTLSQHIKGTDELIIDNKSRAQRLNHLLNQAESPQLNIIKEYYHHINQIFHQYQQHQPLSSLKNDNGEIMETQKDIMNLATNYYMNLFDGKKGTTNKMKIEKYLMSVIPNLGVSLEDNDKLDSPITMEELKLALDSVNYKSTTGIDGIPYKYYKDLFPQIKNILLDEFNDIFNNGQLPFHYRTILFNIIPKPGKSKDKIQNYRPIGLINCNLRLLSTIINNRLLQYLPDLIGESQTGFIPGRSSFTNINIMQDMISSMINPKDTQHIEARPQRLILIVDMEKAFDRISHTYLETLLSHLNLGKKKFIPLILGILQQTVGSLYINQITGPLFKMRNGTLQGNPFSPTLFAMAVEPLLRSLEKNKGFNYKSEMIPQYCQQKYLAFADDITIFHRNESDYQRTIKYITIFEKMSGSKLNTSKSKLLIPPDSIQFFTPIPFDITDKNFELKYLGVTIGSSYTFWPDTLKRDLWIKYKLSNMTSLPISSKIEAFNTYIASKFYYKELHQPLLQNQFKEIDNSIYSLVKQDTAISLETLKTNKKLGGFSLIDLSHQLQYRRAKIFQDLFTKNSSKYNQILRFKIQYEINNLHQQHSSSSQEGYVRTQYWWIVLLGLAEDIEGSNEKITTKLFRSKIFSDAEKKAYYDFQKVLRIRPANKRVQPMDIEINELKSMIQDGVPEKYQKHIPVRVREFEHRQGSKKQREKVDTDRMSDTLKSIINITQPEINEFWSNITKYNYQFPGGYQNLHIFHLGIENHHYITNNYCYYCEKRLSTYEDPHYAPHDTKIQIMAHHLIECPLAQKLWKASKLEIPLTWRSIIIPTTDSLETKKIDKFIGYQRKLSRLKQRNSFNWQMSIKSLMFVLKTNTW